MVEQITLFQRYNLTPYVFYVILIMIALLMTGLEIEVAGLYLALATIVPGVIFLSYLFLPKSEYQDAVKIPVKEKTMAGNRLFAIGFTIPLILALLRLPISKIMSPKLIFGTDIWQAIVVGSPAFNTTAIVGFFAGIFEEFAFGLAFLIAGGIIFYWVAQCFGYKPTGWKKTALLLAGGLFVTVIGFTVWHILNPQYTAPMFIMALIFRLGFNILIFYTGISIAIGFHIANNLVSLGAIAIAGMFGIPGILLLLPIIVIIYISATYSIFRPKKLWT